MTNEEINEAETNKLKSARVAAGLTQAELSRRSGVNIRTVQLCEQGYRDIGGVAGKTLKKLADALKVEIEDLI